VAGGSRPTGREGIAWVREVARRGAGEILLTSMDRDGTRAGYDLELLERVTRAVDVPVIASGGVGTLEHLAEGLRFADAALAASIFHDGEHTVGEAKAFLAARGIEVRP
jgi:cyclase